MGSSCSREVFFFFLFLILTTLLREKWGRMYKGVNTQEVLMA